MPSLKDVPEPDAQLPEDLRHRIRLAWEAQCVEGFGWGQMGHLRTLDVAGLRFIPTLGDLPVNAYSSAWRWTAPLFPLTFAIIGALVVWDPDGVKPWWMVLLASVPIVGLFALSAVLFKVLGRMPASKVGLARAGLYLTKDVLVLWNVEVGKPDDLLLVNRERVRRIYRTSSGGSMGDSTVWIEYQMKGEERKRRTSLSGLGSADRAFLDHWLATGALPLPAVIAGESSSG